MVQVHLDTHENNNTVVFDLTQCLDGRDLRAKAWHTGRRIE